MVRRVVSSAFYPGLLLVSLIATSVGIAVGFRPAVVVMSVILASVLPILLAQRFMPFEASWRANFADFRLDLLHMASTGLATESYRAISVGLLTAGAMWLQGVVGSTLWPTEWPVPIQLGLALLIGDFGAYWVHRTCHASPLFWRIHAMHHSSERLYIFASARNHPMNAILAYGSQLLPLTLLGAPLEVIALISVFTAVNGMLQHANIALNMGWLNWVLATADLHRWHHSTEYDESNTNFGSNIIVWDVVFGTRNLPDGRPVEVGLADTNLPENFLAHLASPFVLGKWAQTEWTEPHPVEAK